MNAFAFIGVMRSASCGRPTHFRMRGRGERHARPRAERRARRRIARIVFRARRHHPRRRATKREKRVHTPARTSWSVLDLVSPSLSSWRARRCSSSPWTREKYAADRIVQGASAGDVTLVTKDVLARAREGSKKSAPTTAPAFIEFIFRVLKRYASSETGIAVAPTPRLDDGHHPRRSPPHSSPRAVLRARRARSSRRSSRSSARRSRSRRAGRSMRSGFGSSKSGSFATLGTPLHPSDRFFLIRSCARSSTL